MSNRDDQFNPEDQVNEDVIIPEDNYDPDDRFTTQDLKEIDELIQKENLLNDFTLSDFSAPESSEDKKEQETQKEEISEESPTTDFVLLDSIPENNEVKASEESPIDETIIEENPEVPIKTKDTETKNEVNEPIKKEKPVKEENKSTIKPIIGKKNSNQGRTKGLPRKRKKSTWKHTLAVFITVVAILGAISAGGVYLLYTANFTDISNTKYTPKEKTEIYTADNVQIAALYSENRSYISIEQVPQDLINALVATEDSRFYSHNGVDYLGVLRAVVSNVLSGESKGQGASTITQQLARLLYLPDISTESTFLDSLNRKFKEISIALQLEDKYTKNQILEMYLNEYFFGSAAYGIEAASETYFGKEVSQLNLAESAMLAGLPQAPSVYAPNVNFDLAKERQYQVLQRMVDAGYITQEQADEAYNTELYIIPWSESVINNQISPGYQNYVGQVIQEYAEAVAPSIMKERGLTEDEAITYARQTIAGGGYKIYTTIYSTYQDTAVNTVENLLSAYGYSQAYGYTAALVSVDRDGAVRAYYGGNEEYSDIDMAASPRQPGSNIKPIYYAMALETGTYSTSSILNDAPINIGGYSPHNYGGGYSGNITFTQSLVQSKNVTSVQIFNTLGVTNAIDWIKQFGFDTITDDDYNLSVALGGFTYGIKPYQMAAAFNTFNDNGVYNQAYFVSRVTTTGGDIVLDKADLNLISKQIMSAGTANTMWNIMNQVVTSGTGTNAQCGLPTAGKTGTTDNNENLWFTGMTSNLTTSIWLGNLDYHVLGGTSGTTASIYGSYLRNLINRGYLN